MEAECRPDHAEGRHRNAQLRCGTHAVWKDVSCRRCGAHCSPDRSQGIEPGDGRYLAVVARPCGILSIWQRSVAGPLFGGLSAARVAGPTVLLVDDVPAAPIRYRESF